MKDKAGDKFKVRKEQQSEACVYEQEREREREVIEQKRNKLFACEYT